MSAEAAACPLSRRILRTCCHVTRRRLAALPPPLGTVLGLGPIARPAALPDGRTYAAQALRLGSLSGLLVTIMKPAFTTEPLPRPRPMDRSGYAPSRISTSRLAAFAFRPPSRHGLG